MTRSSKNKKRREKAVWLCEWQGSHAEQLKIETGAFSWGSRWRHVLLGAGEELLGYNATIQGLSLQVGLRLLLTAGLYLVHSQILLLL